MFNHGNLSSISNSFSANSDHSIVLSENEHYHSGLNFVTPNARHNGTVEKVMKKEKSRQQQENTSLKNENKSAKMKKQQKNKVSAIFMSEQIKRLERLEGYNVFERTFERTDDSYGWNKLKNLKTQVISDDFNEIVKHNGFKNVFEFYNLISRVDLKVNTDKFYYWKLNDGTKPGLLKIVE